VGVYKRVQAWPQPLCSFAAVLITSLSHTWIILVPEVAEILWR